MGGAQAPAIRRAPGTLRSRPHGSTSGMVNEDRAAAAMMAGKTIEKMAITVQKALMSSVSSRRACIQPQTYG